MSTAHLRPVGGAGPIHPAVFDRRVRELLLLVLTGLIPAAAALAVTVELPDASITLVLAVIVGVLGVVALMVSSRLDVTVALLGFYLLLLDGPVKLLVGSHELTGAVPNILTVAVCAGALMRLAVRRERVTLPPMSSWVIAFVAIVVIEAFNPHTEGLLKILAGLRQELEWLPFFFFGYLLMRSRKRFRQLFLIVGVAALANGAVAAYQTELSPTQLASWGPGYRQLLFPAGEISGSARAYTSEGEQRIRPMGLGSDSGFSGGVGLLALPFSLALLAIRRNRRRWVAMLLCLGALLAVLTGLGRSQVIGAGIAVAAFAVYASLAGHRVTRALGAIAAVLVIAVPVGVLLISALRPGTFSRYESIAPGQISTATSYKEEARSLLPRELEANPFGVGLGTSGPTAGFGGKSNYVKTEFQGITSETQYNYLANELGVPGVLLWFALSVYVILFVGRRMRRVGDAELAIFLAGMFAPFVGLFVEGFSGAFTVSAASGPYFWFAVGVAAYWLAGPGRRSILMRPEPRPGAAIAAVAR